MNISSWTSAVAAASRRSRAAAATALAALVLGMTVLVAPSASASSPTPEYFSSLIAGNPSTGWLVDDCYGAIGFVFDLNPTPTGWHHIGGVRVNCISRHSIISATVALYYWNGNSWVQHLNGKSGVLYNTTGSGFGILDTPHYCVGTFRGWWTVGATVSTERASRTVFSEQAPDPTSAPLPC
jgi:hypothetical protein